METIKHLKVDNRRGITNDVRARYKIAEKKLNEKYLTFGTTFGHLLYDINTSVCLRKDIELGIENSSWANDLMITAFQYCLSSLNQSNKKMSHDIRYTSKIQKGKYTAQKPFGPVTWLDLHTPVILLFSKNSIRQLEFDRKAKYHRTGMDSLMPEIFIDPTAYLGEYHIFDKSDMPSPSYILISGPGLSKFPKIEYNKQTDFKFKELEEKFPQTSILYFPKLKFTAGKVSKDRLVSTGTETASKDAFEVVDYLLNNI